MIKNICLLGLIVGIGTMMYYSEVYEEDDDEMYKD